MLTRRRIALAVLIVMALVAAVHFKDKAAPATPPPATAATAPAPAAPATPAPVPPPPATALDPAKASPEELAKINPDVNALVARDVVGPTRALTVSLTAYGQSRTELETAWGKLQDVLRLGPPAAPAGPDPAVAGLDTRVSTLERDVTAMKADVTGIKTDVGELKGGQAASLRILEELKKSLEDLMGPPVHGPSAAGIPPAAAGH